MPEPRLSLVLPCYNEEEVLRNTVTRLAEALRGKESNFELVLVDNGSTDRTSAVIDEIIAEGFPAVKVTVPVNQGYGYGVLQGLHATTGTWVGFVCADGQVEATDVSRIWEIASGLQSPRLVKVRRRFRMDGFVRKVVSIIYNLTTAIIFPGMGTIDVNGNPKILPRSYLMRMDLQSKDWFLDAEVMIKAKRLKLPVLELNVLAQMREGGTSNVRFRTCVEFAMNLLAYRFGAKGRLPAPAAKPEQAARL